MPVVTSLHNVSPGMGTRERATYLGMRVSLNCGSVTHGGYAIVYVIKPTGGCQFREKTNDGLAR